MLESKQEGLLFSMYSILGRTNPLPGFFAPRFCLSCFFFLFPFVFLEFFIQKAVVFIDIPTDCVQHKLLIYFFCGTIVKTSEFFVFLDIPKVPFRLD